MTPRQASFSEFESPNSELDNLLLAVKNLLNQYRENESRFDTDPDGKELERLCGHRSEFGGNFSQLEARLNGKIRDSPYKAHTATSLRLNDLENLLSTETASLPLVELHPAYYETVEESYQVQAGQFNEQTVPILLPVGIEEDFVLYWDPFYDYFNYSTNGSTEMTIRDNLFMQYWSDTRRTRWTLWIDRSDQDTLSRFTDNPQ